MLLIWLIMSRLGSNHDPKFFTFVEGHIHEGSTESRKTLEQKFIFQIGLALRARPILKILARLLPELYTPLSPITILIISYFHYCYY